ncbi:MAG TPA: MATE family efflux transporter, partial [Herpetosiphonaceae bacterium]
MAASEVSARSRVERLGTDGIGALLWGMSAQATFSLLIAAICGIAETSILARGINALAAAGAAIIAPVMIVLGGVTTTLGAGGASVVSRALGAGQRAKAARTVANTFLIFWAAALLIAGAGTLWIEPLVGLLGATDRIAPYAIAYGRVIFLGALTSTGFSTIIRAEGSVRYATAIWVIPLTVNLALCWLCVMAWGLGAAGAALATVAGQAVSAGMSVYFFFFRPGRIYQITAADFKPDWPIIREVLAIGLPSLAKQLSAGLVVVITNNLLRQTGGDAALGVFAVVSRLYAGLSMP